MILHRLRETVIFRLLEAGHGDAVMTLRSVHRDHRSLAAYQNLRGRHLAKQQHDILRGSFDKGSSIKASHSTDLVEEATTIAQTNNPIKQRKRCLWRMKRHREY